MKFLPQLGTWLGMCFGSKKACGYRYVPAMEHLEPKLLLSGITGSDAYSATYGPLVCQAVRVSERVVPDEIAPARDEPANAVLQPAAVALAMAEEYGLAPDAAHDAGPVTLESLRSNTMGPVAAALGTRPYFEIHVERPTTPPNNPSDTPSTDPELPDAGDSNGLPGQAVVIHLVRRRPEVVEPPSDAEPADDSEPTDVTVPVDEQPADDACSLRDTGCARSVTPAGTPDDTATGSGASDAPSDPVNGDAVQPVSARNALTITAGPQSQPTVQEPGTDDPSTSNPPATLPTGPSSIFYLTRTLLLASQYGVVSSVTN